MISSSKYEFNVTYKHGEPDFIIYQRYCHHNFKVQIDYDSKEKSQCANLSTFGAYFVTEHNKVKLYRQEDFSPISDHEIGESDPHNKWPILNIVVS